MTLQLYYAVVSTVTNMTNMTNMTNATNTHGRILPGILLSGVLSQRAAPVELNVELVVVAAGAVDVHAVRIVRVSGRVQQTAERAVESDADFHVVVLALGFDVCEPRVRRK